MNAEIIAVGTELLLGQIANTNGQYLSNQLMQHGVNIYKHTVVGDNLPRIRQAIRIAAKENDIVILTGGLGPTEDDVTRNALAEEYGLNLVYNQQALDKVEAFFESRNRTVSDANRRQALHTEGAHVFQNNAGLACGMVYKHSDAWFFLLPGPPHELKTMVEEEVSPFLDAMNESRDFLLSRVLKFYGIGESALEARVHDLITQQTNPTIAPLAGQDEVTLRLTVKTTDRSDAKKRLDELEEAVYKRCGSFLYGYDEDTLFSRTLDDLRSKGWTLAVAESVSGGLLGASFTDVSGASDVYAGGAITYSNEAKEKQLHVKAATLEQHGAVSEACAKEMAEGVRNEYGTDTGVSLTGVAGPSPQEGHPPGTVFIGISSPDKTHVYKRRLRGDRSSIRRRAVKDACACLLEVGGEK
ncbi:competence/damage-inducible protein A [Salicibibacter halophilus]|uniref:Putative competence-damage inducible protein n=1 Tax=Salicibibacter halophilus TaxID=2502791 RepID=A0A514LEB0_9BACI|nr:competence/damage-inducible protein A [Salicibibacter halophilus]QDI90184.1 competence/damage-inducible protein A [Salicibibacter halophilus]